MKVFTTNIQAISPNDGKLKTYSGPYIFGTTKEEAQKYCEDNGLGYCKIEAELHYTKEEDSGRVVNYVQEILN